MAAPPQPPRPWYISFTAKWSEAGGFDALEHAVREEVARNPLPFYHLWVPTLSWHSTVFAVLEVTDLQPDGTPPSALVCELFKDIARVGDLLKHATELLPLTATPHALKSFDDGTTVQFGTPTSLAKYRESLRPLLRPIVADLCSTFRGVHSLLDNPHKSRGAAFFGSIARSPNPRDGSHLRWQTPLPPISPLTFSSILLLVSDDALTNRHDEQNSRRITVA